MSKILITPRSLTRPSTPDFEPPRVSELLRHSRVIATPHLGAFTTASVRNATQMAVDNLLATLEAP